MEKQNANPTVYNVSDLSHSTFLKGKEQDGKKYKFISKNEFALIDKVNSFEEDVLYAYDNNSNNNDNNNDNDVEMKESKDTSDLVNKFTSTNIETKNKDNFDSLEVFEMIRHLNDPEHPLTLEQLHVTTLENIDIDNQNNVVDVRFTPTIPHCSMATLIGLSIRVKLLRSLPKRFKVRVSITPGTHAQEDAVNKQLNDKERVAAALENAHLLKVVNKCIAHTDKL